MQLLFSLIAITSIWCLGIKIVTSEGMLGEKVGQWAQKKYDEGSKLIEPVIYCHWCMPSTHSLIGFLFGWGIGLFEWHWGVIWYYPLVVAGASILNGILWKVIQIINQD